jgi:selenocysteine-specific elongation factor
VQNHDQPADEVHRGQRAAINLAGVHHDAIGRGQEIATPDHLVPSRLMTVSLGLLASAARPLKNPARVRLHVGTAELIASVVLLDRDRLEPGQSAAAQLFLNEPAVTTWGQPFVVREESPMVTVGGGQVLDPRARKLARNQPATIEWLDRLASADPLGRASAATYLAGLDEWRPDDLVCSAGLDDPTGAVAELLRRGDLQDLAISPSRTLRVHRQALADAFSRIEAVLEKEHDEFPLRAMLDRSRLANRVGYLGNDATVEAVLKAMAGAGRLRVTERGVALPGRGPQLTNNEQKLVGQIIEGYRSAGYHPPSVEEVRAKAAKNQESVPQLIALAAVEGQLVQIEPGFYLHADVEAQLRTTLAERLAVGGMTVSQIREILGVSRRYAVPLCEYLDRIGFTRRDGDLRRLAQ